MAIDTFNAIKPSFVLSKFSLLKAVGEGSKTAELYFILEVDSLVLHRLLIYP
jgi:hypothetical protein